MKFISVGKTSSVIKMGQRGQKGLCFVLMCSVSLLCKVGQYGEAVAASPGNAGEDSSTANPPAIYIDHGSKGWEFSTPDKKYVLQIQSRLQFRYAVPFDADPITLADFDRPDQQLFKINRARLKVGGNVFESWLQFYWEYELASGNLLDFRMTLGKLPYFKIKIGQWVAHFNRERIIYSGEQQMMDRSLINRLFTIDRQQGISFYGRLKGVGIADFNYWLSLFTGTGRGAGANDGKHPMWLFRGQWNFLGRELSFEGSDTQYHDKAAGLFALAATTNRSQYTRFSQNGGGQLEGFTGGQYRVNQWVAETALMYRGFSWQQEFHWKHIKDIRNSQKTTLIGNYVQFGYFFHYLAPWFPKPLETAFRYAIYNPDTQQSGNLQEEYSLALNWFFKGHLNKVTTEVSLFAFQETVADQRVDVRFRIQWDVSM